LDDALPATLKGFAAADRAIPVFWTSVKVNPTTATVKHNQLPPPSGRVCRAAKSRSSPELTLALAANV
jgi:hypothetical protein